MTDTRNDSYGSLLNSVAAARQYGTTMLGLSGLIGPRAAYSQGGLIARIIDLPADLATARGVTIENGGDGIAGELDRLNVLDCLSDGLRWSLLDGGGAIVVMSQDGGLLMATGPRCGALQPSAQHQPLPENPTDSPKKR